ncbi:hypothetical protein CKO10_01045 [Rhodospirillum rubrum]|uniref:hypothetical protein n=2 Tax=Rhodospirillum rubrum TaxID=1085 RepID=UPI001908AF60|nr:hypothetical protein [Rhodospirillum rubrum]MBK1663097.1 hypothetical protein [Rhodospirillum rubrum]
MLTVEKARNKAARRRPSRFGLWLAEALRRLADRLAPAGSGRLGKSGQGSEPRLSDAPQATLDGMLRAYLGERKDSAISKVHLLTLEEIKTAFGDEWPKLSRKAMMLTEGIIRQHMADGDYYWQQNDESYLLLLSGLEAEEAAAKVMMIADLVRKRLLGNRAVGLPDFGVKASAITVSELLESGASPTLEAITRILDERLAEEVGVRSLGVRSSARVLSAQNRIHDSLTVGFRPVWNPSSRLVFAYQGQPYRTTDYGWFAGQWTLYGGYLDPLGIEVDKKVIEVALKPLRAARDAKTPPVIILPLHFRSFTGQNRNEMFSLIAALVEECRKDVLAFELVGLFDGLPLNRLPQVVAGLAKLSRFVAVRAAPDQLEPIRGFLEGVRLLGIDLNDIGRHGSDPANRARVMTDLARFAKERGIASYVWDLRTMEEVRLALDLGYSNLCGQAVGSDTADPHHVYERAIHSLLDASPPSRGGVGSAG